MENYKNKMLTPKERAKDLLERMTVEEKTGQLNQRLYGFRIYERDGKNITLTEEFKEEVKRWGGIGVLYGLYRADPWSGRNEENGITNELSREAYNTVQKYVIEHSRFGIPMLLASECPHGHQALGGGLLPVNLAVGATFHPKLLSKGYEACGRQLASGHVDLALMSVLDILRDPRWGRSEECYSEDPFLSSQMAAAAVSGMQKTGVSAVAKHFCAQGETTGGVNASAARIGERELREIHFPAMQACCDVGVAGVMAAYNEIDGIYCHANPWLLRHVLRGEMGFTGVVMADGLAIDRLNTITGDPVKSGALALQAGVDISLWDEGFTKLPESLRAGYITMEELDEAVLRVLTLKFSRGLFEHPYMEKIMISAREAGVDMASLELAREAAVLLKNSNHILPLPDDLKRIAVLGQNAADRYSQLGDYTPPVREEDCTTILEGLKKLAPKGMQISYAQGCGFGPADEDELDRAVALVRESDVAVLVLGGSSSRFEGTVFDANGAAIASADTAGMDCGEGVDCAMLAISASQEELFQRVKRIGKPVIAIIVSGRPYAAEQIAVESDALLWAFYPGPCGGQAIAEILYGIISPTGRLPVSIPRHPGQLPVYYNHKASYKSMGYYDLKEEPLFRFGDGLEYTEVSYDGFRIRKSRGAGFQICFRVKNTGSRVGSAVPQLYVFHETGSVVPRVRELKGFTKVFLNPGEETSLVMELGERELSVVGIGQNRIVEKGWVRLCLCDKGIEYWSERIFAGE